MKIGLFDHVEAADRPLATLFDERLTFVKAADDAGIWGIGVDKDQYNVAKRVLTSGVKRVDVGIFDTVKSVQEGKFKGGSDLNFNLKNNGMSVGKINPAVPKAFIDEMNKYKQQIIDGTLKVPTAL